MALGERKGGNEVWTETAAWVSIGRAMAVNRSWSGSFGGLDSRNLVGLEGLKEV